MQLAKTNLKGRLLVDNALQLAEAGSTTMHEVLQLAGEGYLHAKI